MHYYTPLHMEQAYMIFRNMSFSNEKQEFSWICINDALPQDFSFYK